MQKSDFSFQLPEELIAQAPLAVRSASRLLVCHRHSLAVEDQQFSQIADYISPGDLLVFNNTRVIPARLYHIVVVHILGCKMVFYSDNRPQAYLWSKSFLGEGNR